MTLFDPLNIAAPPAPPEPELPTKSGKQTSIAQKRQTRLAKAQKVLDEVFPLPFEQDSVVHYASMGEWSTHDLLLHIIEKTTGPAHITAASWSMTEPSILTLVNAIHAGKILSIDLLMDWRVQAYTPEVLSIAKMHAGRVFLYTCHAKVAVITNDRWSICVVGSANFTNNPRIEAGVIDTTPAAARFHLDWITRTIEKGKPLEND